MDPDFAYWKSRQQKKRERMILERPQTVHSLRKKLLLREKEERRRMLEESSPDRANAVETKMDPDFAYWEIRENKNREMMTLDGPQTEEDYNFVYSLRKKLLLREKEERRMLERSSSQTQEKNAHSLQKKQRLEVRRMLEEQLERSSSNFAHSLLKKHFREEEEMRMLEKKERRMLEENERRMLKLRESAPHLAYLRWIKRKEERRMPGEEERRMLEPRRYRTRKEELGEEERRMIDDLEAKILAGLPKQPGCRESMMRLEEDFASSKQQQQQQQHLILVYESEQGLLPGPFKSVVCFLSFSLFVVGSVNGLICIAGRFPDDTLTHDDIWILNPLTQLSIKLPLPASPTFVDHTVSFAFSCFCDSEADSKKETIFYYKVFKIVCASEPYPPHLQDNLARPVVSNHVEVWDSRSPHTWTKIKNVVFPFLFYHPGAPSTSCDIVVEKVAFWIVSGADGLDLFLVSINMETHAVKQISLPKQSNVPVDFLIGNLIHRSIRTFLFGATWEGSFALFERLGFKTMLYNVWAIDDESGGASWIKKATFLVDIRFDKFLGCIDGKLLVEQFEGPKVLFDVENRRGEVINATNTFLVSAHHFVMTRESIEGFIPIQSFAKFPEFTILLPNPGASASDDASGEREPPVSSPNQTQDDILARRIAVQRQRRMRKEHFVKCERRLLEGYNFAQSVRKRKHMRENEERRMLEEDT